MNYEPGSVQYWSSSAVVTVSDTTGVAAYSLDDALGSVRQLLDGSRSVTLAKSYTPYGETLSSSGNGQTVYGFTGEMQQGGLVYLRARYYATYLNQFIQPDTIVPDYENPHYLNIYAYSFNNPISLVDPNGHDPLTVFEQDPIDPQNWTKEEKNIVNIQVEAASNRYAEVINNHRRNNNLIYLHGFCGVRYYLSLVTPEQAFLAIHGSAFIKDK